MTCLSASDGYAPLDLNKRGPRHDRSFNAMQWNVLVFTFTSALLSSREERRLDSAAELFLVRTRAGNKRGACRVGKVGAPGLPPSLGRRLSLPRLRAPARAGLFVCKAPPSLRLCELVSLTSQKRTLGGRRERLPRPRATEAPLLLVRARAVGAALLKRAPRW